jgi:hypothetical protein
MGVEATVGYTPSQTPDAQIGGIEPLELSFPTEGVIFEYTPPTPRMKPNQVRHSQNLAMFTGFWHGSYYIDGRIQKPK